MFLALPFYNHTLLFPLSFPFLIQQRFFDLFFIFLLFPVGRWKRGRTERNKMQTNEEMYVFSFGSFWGGNGRHVLPPFFIFTITLTAFLFSFF